MATLTTIVRGSVADGWISTSQTQPYFDNSPGLSGYLYRAAINYTAGSGAGVDYQVVVKCYFASGTNGTESLNGETVAKVYLGGKCQVDFDDVRFALKGSETTYTYKRTSKTDSDNAVFVVKVGATLDSNQIVYCYFGNASAVDASSNNTLIDVITGVVGAWNMAEANAVDPVVDYSGNGNDGTATGTSIIAGKHVGKTARSFNGVGGGERVVVTANAAFNLDIDFTIITLAKIRTHPAAGSYGSVFDRGWQNGDPRLWLYLDGNAAGKLQVAPRATIGNESQQFSYTVDAWTQWAIVMSDHQVFKYYTNTVETLGGVTPTGNFTEAANLGFGGMGGANANNGAVDLGYQIIVDAVLNVTQLSNMANNYPDVGLVAGSVLVRKWATTTLPTVGSVNSVEKRDFNLAYKINQVTSPAQAAGKDYWVATAHDGNNDVAVIVTEV